MGTVSQAGGTSFLLQRPAVQCSSVSSVLGSLRDERHEESYDERPRGGEEARGRGAVWILCSFLSSFTIIIRAIFYQSLLCSIKRVGDTTTYSGCQRSGGNSGDRREVATISCNSWFCGSPSISSALPCSPGSWSSFSKLKGNQPT